MEPQKGAAHTPLSAGYDTSSCKKTDDAPQAEEKELIEDKNEPLCESQESPVSLQHQHQQHQQPLLQHHLLGQRHLSSPLVAELSLQPTPFNLAEFARPYSGRSLHQISHYMSGRAYSLPYASSSQTYADHQRSSLESFYPIKLKKEKMEPQKGAAHTPLSAGYDRSSCKKTDDAPQAEEKELIEDKNEPLCESQESSVSFQHQQHQQPLFQHHLPGQRHVSSPLVAELSHQPTPFNLAEFARPYSGRSPYQISHYMSGRAYSLPYASSSQTYADHQRSSLESFYPSIWTPSSPWCHSHDAPQAEEKERIDDTNESLRKYQESVSLQHQSQPLHQGLRQGLLSRHSSSPLVPEPSSQPEPLLDSAPFDPTFNVKSPYQPVYEMSGGTYNSGGPNSAQTHADTQRHFLQRPTCLPSSAGYDSGSSKKTDDAPHPEEKELIEDTNESICKNQESPASIEENLSTADEQFSEERVQDNLTKMDAHHSSSIVSGVMRLRPTDYGKRQCLGHSHLPPPTAHSAFVSTPFSSAAMEYQKGRTSLFPPPPPLVHRSFSPSHSNISGLRRCPPSQDNRLISLISQTPSTPKIRHQLSPLLVLPTLPSRNVDYTAVKCDPGREHFELSGVTVNRSRNKLGQILPRDSRTISAHSMMHLDSVAPLICSTPSAQNRIKYSTGDSSGHSACEFLVRSQCQPGDDREEMGSHQRHLTRHPHYFHQQSSDSLWEEEKCSTLPQTQSFANLDLSPHISFEELTPEISVDENYRHRSFSRFTSNPQPLALALGTPDLSSFSSEPCKRKKDKRQYYHSASTTDFPDDLFDQPPPATLAETGMIKSPSSDSQFPFSAGPTLDFDFDSSSTLSAPTSFQSTAPTVAGPPYPHGRPTVLQDSAVGTEGNRGQDAFEMSSVQSESESGGDSNVLMEMEARVTAVNYSVTNTQQTHSHLQTSSDPGRNRRGSRCLHRSQSVPSLSQITSAENKIFTRAKSLPDIIPLRNSFEEFTPDITADEHDETFRFQCSSPGLYQCSVTGLLFHMEGEGDVVYRIVPWNRRLLAQHHKRPAGPLFDITCLQQSVCQLHLPHCEIRSTGGGEFLSVAHLSDEDIEFIAPHKITETHVVINITGFSAFGNVKDEDSPPDPVRALVLLFYRPPADPDPESVLNVLLLPGNVVLRDVVRIRKKLVGPENYIETSSDCELSPKQEYTLSTCPEDDSVLVQPTKAKFNFDNYDNYIPTFQVELEKIMKHIRLFLRDTNKQSVWERRVCLRSTAVKRSCGSSALNLPPHEKLSDIRSSFIEGISGPVLKVLLDKLFEKKVMTDAERESADEMQNQRDKARFVIDTVRRKGEDASSEMIKVLCEADPCLSEHLGLI